MLNFLRVSGGYHHSLMPDGEPDDRTRERDQFFHQWQIIDARDIVFKIAACNMNFTVCQGVQRWYTFRFNPDKTYAEVTNH